MFTLDSDFFKKPSNKISRWLYPLFTMLLIYISTHSFAQNNHIPTNSEKSQHPYYQLKLDATITLSDADSSRSLILWHRFLILQYALGGEFTEKSFNQLTTTIEKYADQIDKDEKYLLLSEAYLQRAFYFGMSEQYIYAAWNFRKARLRLQSVENQNHPNYLKLSGYIDLLLGSIPPQYQQSAKILGYFADSDAALEQMNQAFEQLEYDQTEIAFLAAMAGATFLNDPSLASSWVKKIQDQQQHPSPVDQLVLLSIYHKLNQGEEALQIISQIDNKLQTYAAIFHYLSAETYFRSMMIKRAQQSYQLYLRESGEQAAYRADSQFKLGMLASIKLNKEEASRYFHRAVHEPALTQTDRYAVSRITNENIPHIEIYTIRMLYDGGFLEKAAARIRQINSAIFGRNEDLIEWHYRVGRVYQGMKQNEEALEAYQASVSITSEHSYKEYYQPNAHLQRALIFHEMNKEQEALQEIEKMRSFKNYSYESALRQQAKVLETKIKETLSKNSE
ncbi:MAG: hypothetical protein LAT68_16410 [Cyclobacteriaceae bacterium]|nr:hypothetical protein [Cyclobacteriaceae bacterium]MCH8517886.1 hypothetical protein [Cyclobacteriaceae bacterium]